MDLELLQSISLAVSQLRTVETVLKMIVDGLVESAGMALARVWLPGPGDICSRCRMKSECADRSSCLHLAASAGRPLSGSADWSRLNGSFERFPRGVRKIGWIGSTGESMLIEDSVAEPRWTLHPEWIREEGIHGFAGHPLLFGGKILGVLGVFARAHIDEQQFKWLRVFADQAAVAIANARAFEEIQSLQLRAELENDYLKSEVKESLGGFRGQSFALKELLGQIAQV